MIVKIAVLISAGVIASSFLAIILSEQSDIGIGPFDDGCIEKKLLSSPNQPLTLIGNYKASLLQDIVQHPKIIDALRADNAKYSAMKNPCIYIYQKEIEWIEAGDEVTPFMRSFIENHVADILELELVTSSEDFGEIIFGELILTNAFGANVAITIKTDNFDQGSEEWWNITEQHRLYIKPCEWDDSAEMMSEDINIKIVDDGEFLGVLNGATPCDVLEKKS